MTTETIGAETKRAICCHCPTRCGVLVEVDEDERPTGIRGDPGHPTSKGFLCPRGRAAVEYFEHPGRLDHPLERVGARGEGRWRQLSWDQALDAIAETLLRVRDRHGPEAFAYLCGTFHGADANFGYRLMHRFGSPNSAGIGPICAGPRYAAEALTFGWTPTTPDVTPGLTRAVLLWGQHPSASSPTSWSRILDALGKGARLIVVDPRPTLEARRADLWLQPRPGTDAALALGMIHHILEEGLWDRAFVDRWTTGLDRLGARAAKYPPERAEAIAGVPAHAIRDAARDYARAEAAALASGSPNGMGRNAVNLERGLAILIALTGNLDRPGGNRLVGPDSRLGSKTSVEEYAELPASQRGKRLGADRFRLLDEGFERLSASARRVWGGGAEYPYSVQFLGAAHPPTLFRAILTEKPYPVRALLVQHNNPLGTYPNGAVVQGALTSPNLELSVVHELSMTPTAQLADYVLPAASWMEKPFLWSTGRGDAVMTGCRVTPPRHERRSDYDLCRDLGRRLGQAWPDRVEEVWDGWLAGADVTFDELSTREQFWLPPPSERGRHAHVDPERGAPLGFGTPSGKVELASTVLDELGYDPLPSYDERIDGIEGAEGYPLCLMTGATRIEAHHQDHRQVRMLRARHPDPQVEIDPTTGERHGIREDDWVRISTPRGTLRQRARLVSGLGADRVNAERWWYPERAGTVPTLFGFWESNVGAYVDDDPDLCDPAYGAWPFRVARCRIEKEESHPSS